MKRWHRSNAGRPGCKDMRLRPARSRWVAHRGLPGCMDARSSFKSPPVEMLLENRDECRAVNAVQPWDPADHRHVAISFDGATVIRIFVTDHNDSPHIQSRLSCSLNGEQSVIDRAQCRPGGDNDRHFEMDYEVPHRVSRVDWNQQPPGTLNDQ